MQLDPSEIQDLLNLVLYTISGEANSYEEFVDSGGEPSKHIYWSARRLLTTLQLQGITE
jgi:hypothetical protein